MSLSRRTIDYVRFTINNYTSAQSVLLRLGLDFQMVDYGRWRYRKGALACGHSVEVFWDGAVEGMGVCVSISGEGCRILEQDEHFGSWQSWVRSWIEAGARFTRLDLAIDDESGEIKFERVEAAVRQRDYACRSYTWGVHESTGRRGTGKTLYVGSRQSMAMLRIYDRGFKANKGFSFLRFEWEFTSDRAQAVAVCFAYEGWDRAFGCCRGFIEFKSGEDRHKAPSERTTARWWEELIACSRHVIKIGQVVQESVARSYAWMRRQCAQTMYALTEVQGGSVDWLYDLMNEARRKPTERTRRLCRSASGLVLNPI